MKIIHLSNSLFQKVHPHADHSVTVSAKKPLLTSATATLITTAWLDSTIESYDA